jgi:hypothetical protein
MLLWTCKPKLNFHGIVNVLIYSYSMGECSFGKSFGQTNPDNQPEAGVEDRIWKSIPRAIFDGLAKRYQVFEPPFLFG